MNQTLLDSVITVDDPQVVQAMSWAFRYLKVIAEPS
jgi:threonine dehydratase